MPDGTISRISGQIWVQIKPTYIGLLMLRGTAIVPELAYSGFPNRTFELAHEWHVIMHKLPPVINILLSPVGDIYIIYMTLSHASPYIRITRL